MTHILKHTGIPQEVLDLIPSIVQTCVACRAWAKPLPRTIASVDLPEAFNRQVESDLMFVHKYIIMHFICRCIRWYHAVLIDDKTDDSMIDALDTWVRLHGPMQEFIMDQETGIQNSA